MLPVLATVTKAIQVQIWKRAGKGLIDLNRTPSPEISIDLNKPFEIAPEDTADALATNPKRKRNPTTYEKLREAYKNRDNLEAEEVRNDFYAMEAIVVIDRI